MRFEIMKIIFVFFLILVLSNSTSASEKWPYCEQLKPDIQFWEDVFTRYSRDDAVIHDAYDLSRIYKIIRFKTNLSDKAREKRVEDEKEKIEKALLRIVKFPIDSLSVYEKNLKQQFKNATTYQIRTAAKNLRAQQGLKEGFRAGVIRSLKILPDIKQVFADNNLPEELAYLPHVESSFNPLAKSSVGATGMWQIMRSTARRLLKVNRIIDQRYDIFASTEAAVKILKYNFHKADDWALALTAYNYGLAGILRAQRKTNGDYIKIRQNYKHRRFQFASRNFYPEFLAVLNIMENFQSYFPDLLVSERHNLQRHQLKRGITLPKFCQQMNIPQDTLQKYNPAYQKSAWRGYKTVPSKYWLNIPTQYVTDDLLAYFSTADERSLPVAAAVPVPKKEELFAAFELPGELDRIRERNNRLLSISDLQLIVEQNSANNTEIESSVITDLSKNLAVKNNQISVFAGETLGHYADWLEIPTSRLRQINGMHGRSNIYRGQSINLDFINVSLENFTNRRLNYHKLQFQRALSQISLKGMETHTVQRGETIGKLVSNKEYFLIDLIQYFNSGYNINKLMPGDILRIPVLKSNHILEDVL